MITNYFIEFLDGPSPPASRRLQLPIGGAVCIGRAARCELVIGDRSVSSQHCEIQRVDERKFVLTDLGSRNGTYVGGHRVKQAEVNPGDEIRIGKTVVQVREESSEQPAPANPGSNPSTEVTHQGKSQDLDVFQGPEDLTIEDSSTRERQASPHFSSSLWGDSVAQSHHPHESVVAPNKDQPLSTPIKSPRGDLRATVPTEFLEDGAEPLCVSISENDRDGDAAKMSGIRSVALTYCDAGGQSDEIRIRVGQTVTVGRSTSADVEIAGMNLQPRHFKVVCLRNSVVIESLERRSSLIVNQAPQHKASLEHGDWVIAGEVRFKVEFDGGRRSSPPLPAPSTVLSDARQSTSRSSDSASSEFESQSVEPRRNIGVELEVHVASEASSTGIMGCLGNAKAIPVERLLKRFAKTRTLSMLIDPVRLGRANDPQLNQHLLARDESGTVKTSWIPLPKADVLHKWVERIYGNDCGVVLVSKLGANELRERLSHRDAEGASLVDICWPSLLGTMLPSYDKGEVVEFFRAVEFVVMESESPRQWSIFGMPDSIRRLEEFGLSLKNESTRNKELANA